MKKVALAALAVFAALFVYITINKNKPAAEPEQAKSGHTAIEKEKIIKFWELYRKATDLRMNGQWEQAAQTYHDALDLNGEHEDALYYLGNMYLELGRHREAEQYWQKLAQVNPRNSRSFMQLGNLYLISDELFDIGKAESACLEALKINKEESGPVLSLGEVKLIRGQLDDAATDFKAVTGSNFKSIEAYFLGGYVAWKKGDAVHARDLFSTAVKYAKPDDSNPHKVIGEGDTKKGKSFGDVTNKSIFIQFTKELPEVEAEQVDQALGKSYRSLDAFLKDLRKKIK